MNFYNFHARVLYAAAVAAWFCRFLDTTGCLGRGCGWKPSARPGAFPLGLGGAAGVPKLREKIGQARCTCPAVSGGCGSRGDLSHGRGIALTNDRASNSCV